MIKGITPKLAEAGKIKIGGLGEARNKRGGGTFRLPVKYDHFQITTTNRTEAGDLEIDGDLMAAIEPDADGQVRSIPIVLHSDVIDEVFPTAYARYSGRRCACRGDGETALRREVKDRQYTGESKTIECTCDRLGAAGGSVCKPNGKLFCSIAVPDSAIAGAVHVWRTTSIISIEQMIGSLMQIKAVCGTLRGVPLWLRVRPIAVEPPGQGSITVYCCHVELRAADIREIQRDALDAAKRRHDLGLDDSEYGRMLTLPAHDETTDEESEIANEFYPEDDTNLNGGGSKTPEPPWNPRAAGMDRIQMICEGLSMPGCADEFFQSVAGDLGLPLTTDEMDSDQFNTIVAELESRWKQTDDVPDMNPDPRDVHAELDMIAKRLWGETKFLDELDEACHAAGFDLEKLTDLEAIKMIGILTNQTRK